MNAFNYNLKEINIMTDLEVKQRLDVLKTTFAPGKYWNHDPAQTNDPSSVRDIPCQHHDSTLSTCDFFGGCGCNSFYNSIQCAGFALYMAYRVLVITQVFG